MEYKVLKFNPETDCFDEVGDFKADGSINTGDYITYKGYRFIVTKKEIVIKEIAIGDSKVECILYVGDIYERI